jgi:hypothetical protein
VRLTASAVSHSARVMSTAGRVIGTPALFTSTSSPPNASTARTKAAQIYKKTGNLRAVQLLLGHTKLESTVRYLGIEVDDALSISEQVEL